ncbi:hypothetical protein J6590_006638 [Homalodisca vitripennis]|nr:hypothetical protein J6590_006638 [Homalodisca vitripennis]
MEDDPLIDLYDWPDIAPRLHGTPSLIPDIILTNRLGHNVRPATNQMDESSGFFINKRRTSTTPPLLHSTTVCIVHLAHKLQLAHVQSQWPADCGLWRGATTGREHALGYSVIGTWLGTPLPATAQLLTSSALRPVASNISRSVIEMGNVTLECVDHVQTGAERVKG